MTDDELKQLLCGDRECEKCESLSCCRIGIKKLEEEQNKKERKNKK